MAITPKSPGREQVKDLNRYKFLTVNHLDFLVFKTVASCQVLDGI